MQKEVTNWWSILNPSKWWIMQGEKLVVLTAEVAQAPSNICLPSHYYNYEFHDTL